MHGIPVLIKDNIDTADRMQTTAGSLALLGSKPTERCLRRAEAARGRRRDPGQDQSQRVGEHSLQPFQQRMERARRPDQQSLRARPQSLRIEFRFRRRRCGESVRGRGGHGNRRLDRLPVFGQRNCRHQADARLASAAPASFPLRTARTRPARWRAPCATPRFYWVRLRESIPATLRPRPALAKRRLTTRKFLDPDGLARRAHRRGAQVFRL